ncbi:MAG: hypothetical protein AAF607_03145 [Pseudomonadota bacterium]
MRRLISLSFYLVLGAVCIWLAVANRQFVIVSLAPVDQAIEMPLFFVGLFGVLVGVLAIAPAALLKRFLLNRKIKKGVKRIAVLERERDALMAERDALAAQVRPEDKAFVDAQRGQTGLPGALAGPSDPTVLPS